MERSDDIIPLSKCELKDANRNSQVDGSCSSPTSRPIEMTSFDLPKETLPATQNNLSTSEKELNSLSLSIGLRCKSIRFGSYKCNTENYKKDIIRFERGGMMLKIPPMNANYLVKVKISKKNILKIIAHFSTTSPVVFIHLTPAACSYICKEVQAVMERCDPILINPYYDATSSDDTIKYVTLYPNELNAKSQDWITKIFRASFHKIDKKAAYDMLLKTSPKQFAFNTKFPPDLYPTNLSMNYSLKYCQYPPIGQNGSNCVSITAEDYCCLEENVFLNDSVIDFFLKWLQFSRLNIKDRNRTHIFSTFFYKRLTMRTKYNYISQADTENASNRAQMRYDRVKRWTKNVNIFEKDFVIVPINQHSHWFVAVICFPGCEPGCYDIETGKLVEEPLIQRYARNKQILTSKNKEKIDSLHVLKPSDNSQSDYDEAEASESEIIKIESAHEICSQISGDETRRNLEVNDISSESIMTRNKQNSNSLFGEKKELDGDCEQEENYSESPALCKYSPSSPSEQDPTEFLEVCAEDDVPYKNTKDLSSSYQISPTYSSSSESSGNEKHVDSQAFNLKETNIKQPCIIFFDSLQTKSMAKVAATLRDYLKFEYKAKVSDKEIKNFTVDNLPACCPPVPQQDNSSDCGIYLLQYIESFFDDPLRTYELPFFKTFDRPEQWFKTTSVKQKRESIAKTIRNLTAEQNPGKEFAFPKLLFNGLLKRKKKILMI